MGLQTSQQHNTTAPPTHELVAGTIVAQAHAVGDELAEAYWVGEAGGVDQVSGRSSEVRHGPVRHQALLQTGKGQGPGRDRRHHQ
jgi:hypothetical protein